MRLILAILPTMLLVVLGQLLMKWRLGVLAPAAQSTSGPLARVTQRASRCGISSRPVSSAGQYEQRTPPVAYAA